MSFLHVLFALLMEVSLGKISEFDGFLQLHDYNYFEALEQYPQMLVIFNAPLCGHYRKHRQNFKEAANILKNKDYQTKIALFDMVEGRHIPTHYNIKNIPTIKYIYNKQVANYTGGFTTEEIYKWVREREKGRVHVFSKERYFQNFLERHTLVYALFSTQESNAEIFKQAIQLAEEGNFAVVDNEEVFPIYNAQESTLLMFSSRYDKPLPMNKEITVENIKEFIQNHALPRLVQISQKSVQYLFDNKQKVLLFHRIKQEDDKYILLLKKLVTIIPDDIYIMYGDLTHHIHYRLAIYFGINISKEASITYIVPQEEGFKKYFYEGKLQADEILEFLNSELVPFYKTQAAQELDDESDIKVVAALNYIDFISVEKSSLILFYAPWCNNYRNFRSAWINIAKKAKEDGRVQIGVIDGMENEISDFHISQYPTIVYYDPKAETKHIYTGKFEEDAVWDFAIRNIEKHKQARIDL